MLPGDVFEEAEPGVTLRDVVTEILRGGNLSISQVGAQLKQRGIKLHRLAVAGYLKALADDGYLQERHIPPAKTYSLNAQHATQSLYEVVGQRLRGLARDERDGARIAVQILGDLFMRPVFLEEIKRVGFEPRGGLDEVPTEQRQAARRLLAKTPLKLPFNDPAYAPHYVDADDQARLRTASRQTIAQLLRERFNVQSLALTSKQVTLGGAS